MIHRRTAMKRIAAAAVVAVAAFYAPGRPWEAVPVVNPRYTVAGPFGPLNVTCYGN